MPVLTPKSWRLSYYLTNKIHQHLVVRTQLKYSKNKELAVKEKKVNYLITVIGEMKLL